MAKSQISYGAKGDDVKELQKTLNSKGYSLAVDGIFGNDTKKAVQDYQKEKKLAVDGIVGKNTWASLLSNSTTTTPATTTTTNTAKTEVKAPTAPTYQAYTQSDLVKKETANRDAVNASKPGDYKASNYQTIADEALQKYMNRGDFSYDLNGDALYQQYKDKYIQQGKMAMQDTMGQAAAMTGGYGNSYAATVGNQAYLASLENLNDIVPELYQMAYDRYNQEGQNILNQYSLASERENQEYTKYMDALAAWQADASRADSNYWNTLGMDYSMYENKQNYDVNAYQTALDNYWQDKAFGYQQERGAVADSQWQQELAEKQRQYNESLAEEKRQFDKQYSSGGSGSTGGSGGNKTTGGSSTQNQNSGNGTDADVKPTGFTGKSYSEAVAYMKSKGVDNAYASGVMTSSEWNRRKQSYKNTGKGGSEVADYGSYAEYIADYVEYAIETYGK